MTKRLYRSRKDKVIAGVCGGLGDYFDIDPTIFRLVFVVFTLAGGAGILAYIIGIVLIPEQPTFKDHSENKEKTHTKTVESTVKDGSDTKKPTESRSSDNSNNIGGIILIAIGVLFLLNNLYNINIWRNFWPLILVVLGLAIMMRSINQTKE